MAQGGHDGIVAEGAAAVPYVLERYGKERDEEAAARLHAALVAITAGDQTRLLAKEFEDKLLAVRTFALWRASCFPDPALRAPAEKAWQRVAKLGEKADPDERHAAALCTASTGSAAGLPALFDACGNKRWDKGAREIRAALEGARGVEASSFAIGKLENADRKTKVAALRMLAGCGDRSHAARLRLFLDDEDNSIRVAAINALRGMVDGAPPLEGLSAFEAIEMAKEWKGKAL
jgi:HEAT repeat protein